MAVTDYEYRYATSLAALEQAGWTSAGLTATIPITGLATGTLYGFQTRAKDAAGNYSPPTPTFFETTPGAAPAAQPITFLTDAWTFLTDPITFSPSAGLFGP